MARPRNRARYDEIKRLYLGGFTPMQIGEKIGMEGNMVSVYLTNMRRRGEITVYRREQNVRVTDKAMKPGYVQMPCLSCERPFLSTDKKKHRLCNNCKRADNYMPECAVAGRVA